MCLLASAVAAQTTTAITFAQTYTKSTAAGAGRPSKVPGKSANMAIGSGVEAESEATRSITIAVPWTNSVIGNHPDVPEPEAASPMQPAGFGRILVATRRRLPPFAGPSGLWHATGTRELHRNLTAFQPAAHLTPNVQKSRLPEESHAVSVDVTRLVSYPSYVTAQRICGKTLWPRC